jgi:hypothetical protein
MGGLSARAVHPPVFTGNFAVGNQIASQCRNVAISFVEVNERYGLWVLKKSSFLPNSQNLGDRKCLEN